MKMRQKLGTVAVLLALLVLSGVVLAQAVAKRGRPTAVAVVDVQRVFESLKEKEQSEADLTTKADRLKAEQQDRQRKLEQMQKDMEMLAPGTPAFNTKQDDLERQAVELQAWGQFQSNKLQRERSLQIEGLYRKIMGSVEGFAKGNGYDVVLFKEGNFDFRNANPQQLSALIQVRKVLWSAEDLDITDQITQRMNNEFTNR